VFVSLGLGSVIASAIEAAPWLTIVGRNRGTVFLGVGVLLAFNYWFAIVRPRRVACAPSDVCYADGPASRANRVMFWMSLAIYLGAVAISYGLSWWIRMKS
jgi:hypothetical protein